MHIEQQYKKQHDKNITKVQHMEHNIRTKAPNDTNTKRDCKQKMKIRKSVT